jgi:hypothetical protein
MKARASPWTMKGRLSQSNMLVQADGVTGGPESRPRVPALRLEEGSDPGLFPDLGM